MGRQTLFGRTAEHAGKLPDHRAGRLLPLDGLRAAAVLIVMISHAGLGQIIPGGFGVTIFFFLSGYLITTLMVGEWEKTRTVDLGGFYLRRVVRIIPPMVIAICLAVALSAVGLGRQLNHGGLIWDFLLVSNYAPLFAAGSQIAIPLWSLAIEEHFYLLFPGLFFALRRSRSNVALVCAGLCVAVLIARLVHVSISGPTSDIYYWSHTRIDSILFGCILATWNNPAKAGKTYIGGHIGYAIIGAAIILWTLVARDPVFRETWRYSFQGLGLFLLFNYALRTDGLPATILSARPLKIVADLSYFLYLVHLPLYLAASHLPVPAPVQYATAFAASFLLAAIVRRYVEVPLQEWRKQSHRNGSATVLPPLAGAQ
jgi:peptidoglycan/LPS O-acetylase OafA/YrhL